MLDNLLSEVDVQHLCTLLDKAHNIIVTCHVSPDGGCNGAVLAFLISFGEKVRMLSPWYRISFLIS